MREARSAGTDEADADSADTEPRRLRAKDYMDSFINPPEFIEALKERKRQAESQKRRFPGWPRCAALTVRRPPIST